MERPLYQIAGEIRRVWVKPSYSAKPYLEAMSHLSGITDSYLCDSGYSIILYFLSNATTWKGEDAKRIKAELKVLIKNYKRSIK